MFDRRLIQSNKSKLSKNWDKFAEIHRHVSQILAERVLDRKDNFITGLYVGNVPQEANNLIDFIPADKVSKWYFSFDMLSEEDFYNRQYDVIISNLCWQWSNDLPALLNKVQKSLNPGGLLLASIVGHHSLRDLRESLIQADLMLNSGVYPRVIPFYSLDSIAFMLQEMHFDAPMVDYITLTLKYSKFRELLLDLVNMGAANPLEQRFSGLTHTSLFDVASQFYPKSLPTEAPTEAALSANFDIIFITTGRERECVL